MYTHKHHFVTSQLVWKPVMVQYANHTSVMWIHEASGAQTLCTDFSVEDMNNIYIFIDFFTYLMTSFKIFSQVYEL